MKVILKKEAEFEFNEEKYTAIPSTVFITLVGEPEINNDPQVPCVIVFENKADYIKNGRNYSIDYDKSVYVSAKGQIFCYLKDNATANTKEDKGE